MNFGMALEYLRNGTRVARAGWNGKGMWLVLVTGDRYQFVNTPVPVLGLVKLPWIGMKTADDKFVPWLASQTDLLAEDWEFID